MSDSEVEADMEWYKEHANDHVFYIHVQLRCFEGNEYDSYFDIKEDDPNLPVINIVQWYKERYRDVKSFDICYEWKLSQVHRRHLFQVRYTPEEMAEFLDISNEYYVFTDMIPDMMENVLEYADSDGNYPLIHGENEFLVFGNIFSHDVFGINGRMQYILTILQEEDEKKKNLFEELIPKAWHPDRVMQWCICE